MKKLVIVVSVIAMVFCGGLTAFADEFDFDADDFGSEVEGAIIEEEEDSSLADELETISEDEVFSESEEVIVEGDSEIELESEPVAEVEAVDEEELSEPVAGEDYPPANFIASNRDLLEWMQVRFPEWEASLFFVVNYNNDYELVTPHAETFFRYAAQELLGEIGPEDWTCGLDTSDALVVGKAELAEAINVFADQVAVIRNGGEPVMPGSAEDISATPTDEEVVTPDAPVASETVESSGTSGRHSTPVEVTVEIPSTNPSIGSAIMAVKAESPEQVRWFLEVLFSLLGLQ